MRSLRVWCAIIVTFAALASLVGPAYATSITSIVVSGVAETSQGHLFANAVVLFHPLDGSPATQVATDASGNYSAALLSGDYFVELRSSQEPFAYFDVTVGTWNQGLSFQADTTFDVIVPTSNLTIAVQDSAANPVTDASFEFYSVGSSATVDGNTMTTTIYNYQPTSRPYPVDGSGQVTLELPTGSGFSSPDVVLANGLTVPVTIPQLNTDMVSTQVIDNRIGVASDGPSAGPVTISTPTGTYLYNVTSQNANAVGLPVGAIAIVGALTYEVGNLVPGQSIDVSIALPSGSNPSAVYKLENGSYVDVSSLATISGDTITLHLTDGGLGDADGAANGVIVDPVVPVRISQTAASVVGVGKVSVSYPGGFNLAGPYSGYRATCVSSDGGVTRSSAFALTTPLTVTGLSKGKTYTCTVIAKNGSHISGPSPTSQPVVTPTNPDPPSVSGASVSVGHIAVNFAAPASDGGSPIIGYRATCVSSDGGIPRSSAFRMTSPLTVAGLTKGKTYTCTVVARNVLGLGNPSPSSSSLVVT
jgi:hypothetical protein